MPEFIPQHDGVALYDDFLRGYLSAAEWLIHDISDDPEGGINRDKIRGWSKQAVNDAKRDCADFQRANAADLVLYNEMYQPRGDYSLDECAGHDFWLSRNGHGAGFFDRGNDPVFNRLQDAARRYGGCDVYASRGWLRFTYV